jgi:hypothetical protein
VAYNWPQKSSWQGCRLIDSSITKPSQPLLGGYLLSTKSPWPHSVWIRTKPSIPRIGSYCLAAARISPHNNCYYHTKVAVLLQHLFVGNEQQSLNVDFASMF